jgi:WD40 repeat protein
LTQRDLQARWEWHYLDRIADSSLLTRKGHTGGVSAVSWSPDGSRLLTVSGYLTAKVWDAKTGAEVLTLKDHTAGVFGVSWSPDGSRVLTGGGDNTAKVWDSRPFRDTRPPDPPRELGPPPRLK